MADKASGHSSLVRVTASIDDSSAAGRWVDIRWRLEFRETQQASVPAFNLNGVSASVSFSAGGLQWSGSFTFDWRPGGLQSVLIATAVDRVNLNADGTPPSNFKVTGSIGDTNTLGAGGPTSVAQSVSLPTLKVLPGTPTDLDAARVSDTSVDLDWEQSSASNGQPTSNTIRRRINGGSWATVVTISPTESASLSAAANQKLVYGVRASNSEGDTAWSADSSPIFTTPAAPTEVEATKVGTDIQIGWTPNVAYSEHEHVVLHGVDVAGTVTWDASPLATVTSGTSTYTHASPDPADRHVYRLRARATDVSALQSVAADSNVVQLLTAPAKPDVPALAAYQPRSQTFRFPWVHNPIDTTSQTKRQVRYSLNGGSTWTTGSKTESTDEFLDFAADTWSANDEVTFQVRTKGDYDSGSDGDASYSPWSDSVTVTFKSQPVAEITAPADAGTYTKAALTAVLGFAQAEGASFVSARLRLYEGVTLLEERTSTTLAGTLLDTRVDDGGSYTLAVTVTDSNGVVSEEVESDFDVDYTEPVAAVVELEYLTASGLVQIGLTIPAAGGGLVAATEVSIDRVVDGISEAVEVERSASSSMTFLDTFATINGTNLYRVTTISADGATTVVEASLAVAEQEWAYMAKGPGLDHIIRFQLAPGLKADPEVDSALLKAAGRSRAIGLYATTAGSLTVSGSGALAEGNGGSTPEEIEAFLLVPGRGGHRDPTGRRLLGRIKGSVNRDDAELGVFTFTVEETS